MIPSALKEITQTLTSVSPVALIKDLFGLNQESQEFFDTQDLAKVITAINRPALSSFLPYVAFDDKNDVFINKNSIGFVFRALLMLGSSEEIEKQLDNIFQHTLPKGSNIQFLLLASPQVSPVLQHWESARQQKGELFQKLAARRRLFFEERANSNNNVSQGECPPRIFSVLISVSLPGSNLDPIRITKINQLKTKLLGTFNEIGMPAKTLNSKQFINELYDWLNPTSSLTPSAIDCSPYEPLAKQLVSNNTCIKVLPEAIKLKNLNQERVIKILTPSQYPAEWCLSEMSQFIGDFFDDAKQIPVPFMLHYGVHICDEAMLKTKMMTKCSNAERMAATPIAKWVPSVKDEAVEWGYVREQVGQNHRFVKTQISVLLFSPQDIASEAEDKVMTMFDCKGWKMAPENYTHLLSLIAALPMSWGEGAVFDQTLFNKTKTTLSSEPTKLLPIQGEWHGAAAPGMLFVGRRGQMFCWDSFENRAGNFNVSIAGKSGAGKSFFIEELIMSNIGRGGRAFVLDVGRSYEKICKITDASFIEFSTHSPICINPFTNIPTDDPNEALDALAMLKPIVSLMAAPNQGTTDLENALIEKAILYAWEQHGNKASITNIADHLGQQDDLNAKNLAKMLFPYTKNGSYGRFFEGEANVNLSGDLVVFELEELKERRDLQSVVVQIMILEIANQVYLGDRKTPVQVVLDEAWDMLRGKQSGLFIETAARRLRKYRGALIVGTQSVRDFYASPGAQAAFENSDFTVLLEQKSSSIAQLKQSKHLELTAYMETVLKSVKTIKGKYSDCFIIMPTGFVVGRLILDRFSQLLYTTDASEFAQIEALRKEGMSLGDALERLADEH